MDNLSVNSGRHLPSGTVTFLFTDVEGSTKLAREHPEIWETARARHHTILRGAIEAHQGSVLQIIGNAFWAAFHTAADAVKAAILAQHGLQNEPWREVIISVRMGIHTGEAQAQQGEYHGYLTMSMVQRLMSAGYGGQILISEATEKLLREKLPNSADPGDPAQPGAAEPGAVLDGSRLCSHSVPGYRSVFGLETGGGVDLPPDW